MRQCTASDRLHSDPAKVLDIANVDWSYGYGAFNCSTGLKYPLPDLSKTLDTTKVDWAAL